MRVLSAVLLMLTIVSFQNCSQTNFSMIDPEAKLDKLSTESVFGAGQGEVNANGTSRGGNSTVNGSGAQNGNGSVPANTNSGGSSVVGLRFQCSNSKSNSNGNLAMATSLRVQLSQNNTSQCQFDSNSLKSQIIASRNLPLSLLETPCANIPDGMYFLRIFDPNRKSVASAISLFAGLFPTDLAVFKKDGKFTSTSKETTLISDYNPEVSGGKDYLMPEVSCDENVSPLVLHLNSDVEKAEPLALTSQDDGILYDILGLNADPVAHAKKKISWHRSNQYYFLTLPNKNGQVKGINELFGDNTLGPDGRFAHDGFHALSKFDGMSADGRRRLAAADGLITEADPIYQQLRLWQDRNFDGVAQSQELKTLKSLGIERLDLNYDPNYREKDIYGNETRFKSVAQDRHGQLHLLFDVWFRYQEPKQVLRGLASQ